MVYLVYEQQYKCSCSRSTAVAVAVALLSSLPVTYQVYTYQEKTAVPWYSRLLIYAVAYGLAYSLSVRAIYLCRGVRHHP